LDWSTQSAVNIHNAIHMQSKCKCYLCVLLEYLSLGAKPLYPPPMAVGENVADK